MKKAWVKLLLGVLIVLMVAGLVTTTIYFLELPDRISQHETILIGQNRLVPGSQAAMRVVTRNREDAAPLENTEIRVSMRPVSGGESRVLFEGLTDKHGAAEVLFQVPTEPEAEHILIVETTSAFGSDTIERPVMLAGEVKVLLTTDKPVYQPGQVIHIRTLALNSFDRTPIADQDVEVVIADGKGNKVFRKIFKTSNWGVAAVDFQLASEVNSGAYKISATLSNTFTEKTVMVEHYVLPKFKVSLETERSYYLPGDRVSGSLHASYFFGKPVIGGEVVLEGYVFDVERVVSVTMLGETDEAGWYFYEFDLPGYLAGTDFEAGLGRFYLQAVVTDQTRNAQVANLSLPVSSDQLVIEAIPEGGQFKTGVENLLYILTSYPDGMPAETQLEITFYNRNETIHVESGTFGLATVPYTPGEPWQGINIQARDSLGHSASREFYFEGSWSEESVLLRPEKPVYRVGEPMELTILTSTSSGTVYLDIIREDQTVLTDAVDVVAGKATLAIDLTPDLYGTLELHAYKILASGSITRDTRLVVVDQADDLNLTITAGEQVYLPGETAQVFFQVRDQGDLGVQSAIGLAVVDEAVFALAEQDPGFAKLYFMLENELLQPKYDLHGYDISDLIAGAPVDNLELENAIERTAQASLAETIPQEVRYTLEVNSHQEALYKAYQHQEQYFQFLGTGFYGLYLVIASMMLVLAVVAVAREKLFLKSVCIAVGIIVLPLLILWVWPHPWARNPVEKLELFLEWLSGQHASLLWLLAIWVFSGLIALIVVAVKKKDRILGWMLGLIPIMLGVLGAMFWAISLADLDPTSLWLVLGVIAFFKIPAAFLLRVGEFIGSRRALAALAALPIALFLGFGLLPVLLVGGTSMMGFGGGAMMRASPAMELAGVDAAMGLMPAAMDDEVMFKEEDQDLAGEGLGSGEPPRLRQYFPETMLWLPDLLTDEQGELAIEFPVADNITTWRMTALASSQDGRLGSTTASLRVFQDFFIDLDLPLALTAGDEVSVPVGVFNYLAVPQKVQLVLETADWFELLGESQIELEIAPNEISVVYFRIRATRFGQHPFQVTAWGSKMSDAIVKEVRVYPDGKEIHFARSDRLTPQAPVAEQITLPEDVSAGTQRLAVKIYPGILSQVVEGLESILRMPYGCFEQTSSITYPNVLVLDYLKFTDQAAPELQFKAEEYINLGYQRLTTFEVGSSGGFSLFGDAPADRMLTAYGLQEFSDMSRVHNVDPALVQRAADWIFTQQAENGSWENDRGLVHENIWSNLGDDRLPVTAYIVWSLADAGFSGDERTQAGVAYLKENGTKAEDAYSLALLANALVAMDIQSGSEIRIETLAVLERLAGMAIQEGNGVTWQSKVATFMGGKGQTGSIETTALAAFAFLRANRYPELANAALTTLIQQKDSFGTWYSTQATVMALKALIQSVRIGAENVDATVTIQLNDGQTRILEINRENYDVVQMVTFEDINIGGPNLVSISVEGEGNLMYQISGSYYLPWEKIGDYPQLMDGGDLVDIEVKYDRTEMAVNDTVGVQVIVSLNQGRAESALIDLGLPPGFSVETEDLAALVARFEDVPVDYADASIERFELTGRQILVYVTNLTAEKPLEFSYRLRAKFPLEAQTPASNAYDYYNPDVNGDAVPLTLVVQE